MYRTVMLFLAVMFSPVVVAAQPPPCTTEGRQVVDQLYRHMLERQADTSSAHWVQRLESGQTEVRSVVRAIAKSPEYIRRFYFTEVGEGTPYERSVGRLYRHILGRQPDAQGQRVNAELAQRGGAGAVIDRIIDSDEYDQQFGAWGVPGSGGIRYCAQAHQAASHDRGQAANQGQRPGDTPLTRHRFESLDRNHDTVISWREWRGNRQSFDVHDWNNDGVLAGDEIDEASARHGRTLDDEAFDRADRFEDLDVNHNGRLELDEWHGTMAAFQWLDQNDDRVLSRAEMVDPGVHHAAAATADQWIRVKGTERWTDTGLDVREGDTLLVDAQGTVRLSDNGNDIAGVGGALSGRRARSAPLSSQTAGALIAQIGTSDAFAIGSRRSVRAPATGRLYLGVNDDHLADNRGDFQVMVTAHTH